MNGGFFANKYNQNTLKVNGSRNVSFLILVFKIKGIVSYFSRVLTMFEGGNIELSYDRGTLLIKGPYGTPFTVWDGRVKAFRASACKYGDIKGFLVKSGLVFRDQVMDPPPMELLQKTLKVELRDYQREALDAWRSSGFKGVIVLPPGSGKTLIALEAMAELKEQTLIVVPTLPLLSQWRELILKWFGFKPGVLGGGRKDLRGVTVSTYDSAYLMAEELGNKFYLVVFDECHHLASEGYSQIGEMVAAEHRLGLTATFEREDGAHVKLFSLIGGIVYRAKPIDFAGKHLASFNVVKVPVNLTGEEKAEYYRLMDEYREALKRSGVKLKRLSDFKKLVMRSGVDKSARKALISRNKARKIAINSSSKLKALSEILRAHRGDKVLIFTEYNEMAHLISSKFLIPVLTHRTTREEREEILEGFRTGRYTKVVTSKVLDEGLDVPDARVAIVLGGSGSRREFIQRLGRILRKKRALSILYEVVSTGTMEVSTSYRRKKNLGR